MLTRIVKGYISLFQENSKNFLTIIKMVLFLFFVIILSSLIVYPLWYMATNNPNTYSRVVLIVFLTLPTLYIIYKSIKVFKDFGFIKTITHRFFPIIKKILKTLLKLTLLLLSIFLINLHLALGIIYIIIWIFIYGIFKFKKN